MQDITGLTAKTFKNEVKMAQIKTEKQYDKAVERIEDLLQIVGNHTPKDDKYFVELDLLSDLVAEYEEQYHPVSRPTLPEIIRLRMAELGISQKKLAGILQVSPSRISEYLSGKSEPTLKVARRLSVELGIDADIILG
jgi:HTH-type transcriptional regulator / antitoxin HigA